MHWNVQKLRGTFWRIGLRRSVSDRQQGINNTDEEQAKSQTFGIKTGEMHENGLKWH